MALIKIRQTLLRTIVIKLGISAIGFFSRDRDCAQLQMQQGMWEFIAKEQGRDQWIKNYQEKTLGKGRLWLKKT